MPIWFFRAINSSILTFMRMGLINRAPITYGTLYVIGCICMMHTSYIAHGRWGMRAMGCGVTGLWRNGLVNRTPPSVVGWSGSFAKQ